MQVKGLEFATCIADMAHLLLVVGAGVVVAVSVGCGVSTTTQERHPGTLRPAEPISKASAMSTTILVPRNPADLGIRRELNLAISRDAELSGREISYIVANGDVSVTGTVRTEEERRKMNDLAMNIVGVKSIANALRVAE